MYGHKLNRSYRIRLSEDDLKLLDQLKELGIVPSSFVRNAIREKISKELPELLEQERRQKEAAFCPF
jgi:hypothetical protein